MAMAGAAGVAGAGVGVAGVGGGAAVAGVSGGGYGDDAIEDPMAVDAAIVLVDSDETDDMEYIPEKEEEEEAPALRKSKRARAVIPCAGTGAGSAGAGAGAVAVAEAECAAAENEVKVLQQAAAMRRSEMEALKQSAMGDWAVQVEGKWFPYEKKVQQKLEKAFHDGVTVVKEKSGPWTMNLKAMTQTNDESGKVRTMRRAVAPADPKQVAAVEEADAAAAAAAIKAAEKRAAVAAAVAAAAAAAAAVACAGGCADAGARTSVSGGDGGRGLIDEWVIDRDSVTLRERLGAGAFGEVRKGRYHGADVAVKLLFNKSRASKEQLAKAQKAFIDEAAMMVRLRHPNIVAYLGACVPTATEDGLLVMEYLPDSLDGVMSSMGRATLPFARVLRIAMGVASGMRYLHAQRPAIIHRDLKPANVLVGSDDRACIADFGISRNDDAEGTMTKIGTPLYSAPEVLLDKQYDGKVDVFSFGIMLCELVTNRRPYADQAPAGGGGGGFSFKLMERVARKGLRPTLPSGTTDAITSGLARLAQDCWRHDPKDRPTFRDVAMAVEALLK